MNEARSLVKTASQWTIGFILTIALILFLVVLVAAQVTSGGAGQRALRRAVAATTDIDAALPGIEEALHKAAAEGSADHVTVPDYPIPVELPRSQAATVAGAGLRDALLMESGRRLYDDGWSTWDDLDAEGRQDVRTISTAGLLKRGLGLIDGANHRIFLGLTVALGLLVLGLAASRAVSLTAYSRLVALGSALTAAALPLLAGAVAVRFGFRTAAVDADPFAKGLLDLGVSIMAVAIRTYVILSLLGLAVALVGAGFLWWEARTASRRSPDLPAPMP